MKIFIPVILALGIGIGDAAQANGFSLHFTWDGLASCTSGNPNTVDNPRFTLKGLPAGTQSVAFRLRDLNAPSYAHGGGTAAIAADGTVEPGAFKYKSPCPPGGQHKYEWSATAQDGAGNRLGIAKAIRPYPE